MLTLAPYRGFILDLDGTLIDSEAYHRQAFAQAMAEMAGYALTAADADEFVGNTSSWLAARLAERHRLQLDPPAVAARTEDILDGIFRPELFPGAGEFVRAHAGRVPMALASNSPRRIVLRAIEGCGLRDCFTVVVSADDVQRRKPDPEMLLLALHRLGTPSGSTLVIEDTALGVEAGLRAGCPVALVDNGLAAMAGPLPAVVDVVTWAALLQATLPA